MQQSAKHWQRELLPSDHPSFSRTGPTEDAVREHGQRLTTSDTTRDGAVCRSARPSLCEASDEIAWQKIGLGECCHFPGRSCQHQGLHACERSRRTEDDWEAEQRGAKVVYRRGKDAVAMPGTLRTSPFQCRKAQRIARSEASAVALHRTRLVLSMLLLQATVRMARPVERA